MGIARSLYSRPGYFKNLKKSSKLRPHNLIPVE